MVERKREREREKLEGGGGKRFFRRRVLSPERNDHRESFRVCWINETRKNSNCNLYYDAASGRLILDIFRYPRLTGDSGLLFHDFERLLNHN